MWYRILFLTDDIFNNYKLNKPITHSNNKHNQQHIREIFQRAKLCPSTIFLKQAFISERPKFIINYKL